MSETEYRRAANLLEADVGDELVALEPDQGACFGFNEVATSVWRALDQPRTFEDLRAGLLNEYEVSSEQCSAELRELLRDMIDKGLVTATGG
jgi:hypothetical protein